MELQKYIGDAILQRRKTLGLSRYELERRSGVTYSQLLNIERGQSTSTRLLSRIFDVLGLELSVNVKN